MATDAPREKAVGTQIEAVLRRRKAWWVKTCPPLPVGTPDYLVCHRGVFIAVEAKRPGKRPRRIQQVILDRINLAGGLAITATSGQDVEEVLDQVDEMADSI